MPEQLTTINKSILQPDSQIVYNTIYFQRLLEKQEENLNIPINEYLSRIVNLNLKSVVDNDYKEYKTDKYYVNEELIEVKSNSNCLLNGFEVGLDYINKNILGVKVYPGTAILNNLLVELYETVVFEVPVELKVYKVIIVLAPNIDFDNTFSILFYNLDENNVPLDNNLIPWNNEQFLPIGLFEITEKESTSSILALETLGIPIFYDENENPPLYNIQNELTKQYFYSNLPISDNKINNTVLGTKSLTPLYSPPKFYNINNYNYIIPNYGEHVNNGYFLFKYLYNSDYFIFNWFKSNFIFNQYFSNLNLS